MNVFERLKKKWGIKNNLSFLLIMTAFSFAGMNVVICRKPLFHLLGIHTDTALWIKILAYLGFVFPIYQISLLLYGFLLGQFDFFWNKQKSMLQFIGRKFTKAHTA